MKVRFLAGRRRWPEQPSKVVWLAKDLAWHVKMLWLVHFKYQGPTSARVFDDSAIALFLYYIVFCYYIHEWSSNADGKSIRVQRERPGFDSQVLNFIFLMSFLQIQYRQAIHAYHGLAGQHHQINHPPDPAPSDASPWWTSLTQQHQTTRLHWAAEFLGLAKIQQHTPQFGFLTSQTHIF